ncbi:MAG: hypothetical protein FWC13_00695 [Oscillospiraceae bacterium]|nr:hypothetical protein [Oscillospiraceae bacterium]
MILVLLLLMLLPGVISVLTLWLKSQLQKENGNPISKLIIRNYLLYSVMIVFFAVGVIFVLDLVRSISFIERITSFRYNFTPSFILNYSAVALIAAVGLPFVFPPLIRIYEKHKKTVAQTMRKFIFPLAHLYRANKHHPAFRLVTVIPVVIIAILGVVFVVQHYTRSYAPIILAISPNEIIQNPNISGETEITVEGIYLSLNTAIYVNNLRVNHTWIPTQEEESTAEDQSQEYEYHYDDYESYEFFEEISFFLPPELLEPGEVSIVAINNADGIIPARSNELVLNIMETIPPMIHNIAVTTFTDMTAVLHIHGENFESTTRVMVNGAEQSFAMVEDEQNIVASINLVSLPLYGLAPMDAIVDKFDDDERDFEALGDYVNGRGDIRPHDALVVVENYGGIISNEYLLTNLPRIDTAQTISNRIDWLNIDANLIVSGGITNSEEAFLQGYEDGFRIFEFSTLFSADGMLFSTNSAMRRHPNLTFYQQKNAAPFTLLTFEDILRLMLEYDDWWLITETGYQGNFHALYNTFEYMMHAIEHVDPALINRVIVQIYDADMFHFIAENFSFTSFIFNIRSTRDDSIVLDFLDTSGVQAVILPITRATEDLMYALGERDIAAFAQRTDDRNEVLDLLNMGFRGVYTQFLTPRLLSKTENEYEEYSLAQTLEHNYDEFTRFVSQLDTREDENLVRMIFAEHFINRDVVINDDSGDGSEISGTFTASNVNTEYIPENLLEYFMQLVNLESSSQLPFCIVDSGYLNLDGFVYSHRIDEHAITYIVYDLTTNRVVQWVVFEPQNHFNRITHDIRRINNSRNFVEYLEAMHGDDSVIILSVKDEASNHFDYGMLSALASFGLEQSLYGRGMYSYIAIIDDNSVIFESLSTERIDYSRLIDRWLFEVTSAGRNVGDVSKIMINGVDHSPNERGINIVVFNKRTGTVVASVAFDTHDRIEFHR